MANERADDPDLTDSLSKGVQMAEQSQRELDRLRALIDDTSQLVAELGRATAVFESIADELVAATLRASSEATRAGGGGPTMVALVEELGSLARRSLLASSNGRWYVREYHKAHAPTATAGQQAHAALDGLSVLLKRLAEEAADRAAIPVIEVEARPPAPPQEAWRTSLATAVRDADPSKPRRYKN